MRPETEEAAPEIERDGATRRKPYHRPTVRPLGDLRGLTRGGQGSMNDARNRHNWKPY